jgi:hypothetical protein
MCINFHIAAAVKWGLQTRYPVSSGNPAVAGFLESKLYHISTTRLRIQIKQGML